MIYYIIRKLWVPFFFGSSVLAVVYTGNEKTRPIGLFLLVFSLSLLLCAEYIFKHLKDYPERAKALKYLPIVCAFILSLSATFFSSVLNHEKNKTSYATSLVLWTGAGITILLSYIKVKKENIKDYIINNKKETAAILILTLFASLFRFYLLGKIPAILNGDEGWTGMAALKMLPAAENIYNNPFSSFEGFGRLQLNIFEFFIRLFGRNAFALRLFPAISGVLAIPATYILAKYILGRKAALISAFLLAVSHTHIHFSRTSAVAYIHSSWLAPLELYLFLSGLMERSRNKLVIAGIILGIHFLFYFEAWIIAGFLAIFLLITFIINRKHILGNLTNLIYFTATVIIIILPYIAWSFNNPADFSARWVKEGSFQSGWMDHELNITGKPMFLILWGRVSGVFLSIFALPSRDFYWAPVPVLHYITAALFLTGLAVSLLKIRDIKHLFLNGWLWSGILSIGIFAIPPSADSYRLLMILPAMVILAGLGWKKIAQLLGDATAGGHTGYLNWTAVLLITALILNMKTYFIDFARSCRYLSGDITGRGPSLIGEYLRKEYPFDQAYFLGNDDYRYGISPALNYLSGEVPVENIPGLFQNTDKRGSLVFIIIPSRQNELITLKQYAPGGKVTRISDCGELAFIGYKTELD